MREPQILISALAVILCAACSKKDPPPRETASQTQTLSAVSEPGKPTLSAPSTSGAPSTEASAVRAAAKVVTIETGDPLTQISVCNGEDLTIVVPQLVDTDFAISRPSPDLPPPQSVFVERWLGPNVHANKLTFKTAALGAGKATDVEFTDTVDKTSKFVVRIRASCAAASPGAANEDGPVFKVIKAKRTQTIAEACSANIESELVFMAGRDPKKPCDFDEEDGFAIAFGLGRREGKLARLPAPGSTLQTSVEIDGVGSVQATAEILRHQKPFVVLRLTPTAPLPAALKGFGGVLRARIQTASETGIDPSSWKR